MTNDTITKTVFFTAKRDVVWSFLTDKDKLATWFHGPGADLADGEDYTVVKAVEDGTMQKIMWGTVLVFEPVSLLKYTFFIAPSKDITSTVTWTLKEIEGGTKLTMHHEGLGALEEGALELLTHLDIGWDRHLGQLRTLVGELQPA